MAIGMTLLIPTFNAINNSYIEVTDVPPWMPPPESLPENFRPPEDFEPPEDWQPPPDWDPPEGWEDWEPPEDWEGKFEGEPPPGWDSGQCPPPVIKRPSEANGRLTIGGTSWSDTLSFTAPEYTAAIIVNATFRDWVASEVRAEVDPPANVDFGSTQSRAGSGGTGTVISGPSPQQAWTANFTWDPRERNDELPPPGQYTITLEADTPSSLTPQNTAGTVDVETILVLPCGGAFQ